MAVAARPADPSRDPAPDPEALRALAGRFAASRAVSEALAAPLAPEDWTVQSMEAASPVKWNLAHTAWFYETFVLEPFAEGYRPYDPAFGYLFNSYYNGVGARLARASRGLISRPTGAETLAYRRHVTGAVAALLAAPPAGSAAHIAARVALGIAHEEQHQELLLTDIRHALFQNPLKPAAYADEGAGAAPAAAGPLGWAAYDGGPFAIGHDGDGFAFDNEGPRHTVHLRPFALADRPTTNAEFAAFVEDGGYGDPRWWLDDGWAALTAGGWTAPLYWRRDGARWVEYTLFGERPLDPEAPVSAISLYEAAAYAEWTGYRLPTEFEWERAAAGLPVEVPFLRGAAPAAPTIPAAPPRPGAPRGLFGGVWEWTASPYVAYPGYRAARGAIGEYNGKFMSSQMVLRGGSCASPEGHLRATYRNFFPPGARWQVAGLRLARDVDSL